VGWERERRLREKQVALVAPLAQRLCECVYVSVCVCVGEHQKALAEASRRAFQQGLDAAGYGTITTEIRESGIFFYAEEYHQQYLSKNPGGYCGLSGTGVSCPVGVTA
jgi:peptide-methionine (S)-S-oxide reductase